MTVRSYTTDGISAGALREDFRTRGRSSLKCVPPNRKCGGRCIPPEWDCRLKGEGDDPHLKAAGKGSDPIAGFANIERGLKRLGKGAVKLSFSEIEGGRRALARGTAKLSPGDLKQKKELQDKVYKFGLIVGAPISLAIFAGLSHRGLKAFPRYREGWGRQVDEAMSGAIRRVQRNNPIGGAEFRAREAAGPEAVQSLAKVERNLQAGGPDRIQQRAYVGSGLTRTARTTLSGTGQESGRYAISKALSEADAGKKGFSEWEDASLKAFWSTKDVNEHLPVWLRNRNQGNDSIFSVPAATKLYADSMGFTPTSNRIKSQANDVVAELGRRLNATGDAIVTSMKAQGLNPNDRAAVSSFVRSIKLERPLGGSTDVQAQYYNRLIESVTSKDYQAQAQSLFRDTVDQFDRLFLNVATTVTDRPNLTAMPRKAKGQASRKLADYYAGNFYRDGSRAWTEALVEKLKLPEEILRQGPVQGPATGLIMRKVYHTNFVMKQRGQNNTARVALTPTEALTAGTEIARARGLASPSTANEALAILNNFYTGPTKEHLGPISLIEARPSTAARRKATPETPSPKPAAKPPTRAAAKRAASNERWQRLKGIMEERNPDGSKRYKTYAAAVAELERRMKRSDVAAQERADFTPQDQRLGKPCGNGFVAKSKKCTKPTGRGYAKPPEGYRGGFVPRARKTPHAPSGETAKKVATVAAGAIALAAGGRAAYANRVRLRAGIKRVNPELYNRVASRTSAVRKAVQKQARNATLKVSTATINTLSADQVKQGLDRIPAQWQDQARSLVGKAKVGAAYVAARAQDMEVINVNTKSNFTTFRAPSGHMLSVGSSGDALLTFNSEAKGKVTMPNGEAYDKYGMAFQVDLSFDQRKNMTRSQSSKIVRDTKAMFTDQIQNMPDNAFLFVKAYADDGLGDKRGAVYTKWGFRELKGVRGGNLWALKNQGKFTKIPEAQDDYIAELLRGRRDSLREDKKCGKSGIPDNRKCTVPTQPTAAVATRPNAAPERGILKAGLAVGAVATLATALATRNRWTPAVAKAYRQAVAKAKQQGKGNKGEGIFADLSQTAYLAEGVNGYVYTSLDEKSIFKVPKGKVDEKALVREIYTQSQLHKAGVSVPEIKAYDLKRGIVQMEYLKDHKAFLNAPLADRDNNYKTLVGELHKMAKAGFSHGDLHSGNVLVKGSDVKIIDFGSARKAGDSLIADINKLLTDLEPSTEAKTSIKALRKPLEEKISSGKGLEQADAVTFYERLLASLS